MAGLAQSCPIPCIALASPMAQCGSPLPLYLIKYYFMSNGGAMATSYTIGEHFEGFIKELLESGRYSTASEVMRDGLRLVEEREERRKARLAALRAAVQEGLDSGPAEPWDVEEVIAEGQRRRSARAHAK
jgi:antitoxin ParD1/3/4